MNTKEAITQEMPLSKEMLFRPEDSQGLVPFLAGAAIENLSKLIEEVNYNIGYYKEVGKETLQRAKKEPLGTTAGTLVALNLLLGACSKPTEDIQEPTPITEVLPTRTPTVPEPTKTPSPSPTEVSPTPEPEPTLVPTIVPEYPTFGTGGEYPEELREIEDVLRQEDALKEWSGGHWSKGKIFHPETDELRFKYYYKVDEQGNIIKDKTKVILEAIEGEYKEHLILIPIDLEQAEGRSPGDLPPVFQESPPEREGEFTLGPEDPTRPLFIDITKFKGIDFDFERQTFVAVTEDGRRFYMDCFGQWFEEIEPTPEPTETLEPTPTQKPPTPTQEPTQPPPPPTEVPPTPEPEGNYYGYRYMGVSGVCMVNPHGGLEYNGIMYIPGERASSYTSFAAFLRDNYYPVSATTGRSRFVPHIRVRITGVSGGELVSTVEWVNTEWLGGSIVAGQELRFPVTLPTFAWIDRLDSISYTTISISGSSLASGALVNLAPKPNAEGMPDVNAGWAGAITSLSNYSSPEECH